MDASNEVCENNKDTDITGRGWCAVLLKRCSLQGRVLHVSMFSMFIFNSLAKLQIFVAAAVARNMKKKKTKDMGPVGKHVPRCEDYCAAQAFSIRYSYGAVWVLRATLVSSQENQ